jgi:hypothetical protein
MNYTIYNPDSGHILHTLSVSDDSVPSEPYIVGDYSAATHYVVDHNVVAKPARPEGEYDFDYDTKTWQLNQEATKNIVRYQRNQRLVAVDRVNPVWYASLTSQQQSELAQYRQCLLDVPQQPGWPESVTWPRQPTWL